MGFGQQADQGGGAPDPKAGMQPELLDFILKGIGGGVGGLRPRGAMPTGGGINGPDLTGAGTSSGMGGLGAASKLYGAAFGANAAAGAAGSGAASGAAATEGGSALAHLMALFA